MINNFKKFVTVFICFILLLSILPVHAATTVPIQYNDDMKIALLKNNTYQTGVLTIYGSAYIKILSICELMEMDTNSSNSNLINIITDRNVSILDDISYAIATSKLTYSYKWNSNYDGTAANDNKNEFQDKKTYISLGIEGSNNTSRITNYYTDKDYEGKISPN
jgi:hypothetical protein